MRIGSLCTGYGGLDMSVQAVIPADLAWVADPDPGASALLAHHHPQVPNLGDITAVDWPAVEPVDVLTAGFPCQPVSVAGTRTGTDDERWLFDDITTAIRDMVAPPGLLVFENVPGLLAANRGDAMARVVSGLAALGYVGTYRVLRASDAGAPHRRERVFIAAWPAHTPGPGLQGRGQGRVGGAAVEDPHQPVGDQRRVAAPGQAQGRRSRPDARLRDRAPATHTSGDGRHQGRSEPAGVGGGSDVAVGGGTDWGPYAGAIARWERVIGRSAPAPTEPGRTGPRLSPVFVEWLMGLPEGYVTAPGIGLSRSQQLRLLGNGVVPQQGAAALRLLLDQSVPVAA